MMFMVQWLRDVREPKQTCWVYCPECKVDMTRTSSGAMCTDEPGQLVNYWCRCGTHSEWDFGMPVPVLIQHKRAGRCPPHDPEFIGTTHVVCKRCKAEKRLRHG